MYDLKHTYMALLSSSGDITNLVGNGRTSFRPGQQGNTIQGGSKEILSLSK